MRLIDYRDCLNVSILVAKADSLSLDAIEIYNKLVAITNKQYSQNDTKWLLQYISDMSHIDKRLIEAAIQVDGKHNS